MFSTFTIVKSNFNPRSREGSDIFDTINATSILISIHAPARGATMIYGKNGIKERYFNPRSREGSDLETGLKRLSEQTFQSTLPRGERLKIVKTTVWVFVFQSTLPRGERQGRSISPASATNISIHAPARGATVFVSLLPVRNSISIHAPARGATHLQSMEVLADLHFNPRSREGSDFNFI